MNSRASIVAALSLMLLLSGCAGEPAQPLSFEPAPWQASEVSTYDILDAGGANLAVATWRWEKTSGGWAQHHESTINGRTNSGVVMLDEPLRPLSASREADGSTTAATYGAETIDITRTAADGTTRVRQLKSVADAVDNEASLQVQRALPLDDAFRAQYTDIIPATAAQARVQVRVTGVTTITVPAGTYATCHVLMDFGSGRHDGWYGVDAPHPLVAYRNQASGAVFALRSLSVDGQALPPPAIAGASGSGASPLDLSVPNASTQPKGALLLSIFGFQLPVMLGVPLLLGWYIRRRWDVPWSVWLLGCLTFILSQVGHVPANFAIGLIGGGRGAALLPLVQMALVAGLSAGLFEEGARWLILKTAARKARGWRAGLQFGAGHGGIESIILGLLVGINVVAILAAGSIDPAAFGLSPQISGQLRMAQDVFWDSPAYLNLLGGLERVLAMVAQIAMASLVMRSITHSQPLYWLAALAWHTLIDFWAVWGGQTVGVVGVEAGLVVFGLASAWIIWRLRETEPVTEGASVYLDVPAPTAAQLRTRELTDNELARRASASRYE